ncbi:FtsK/SpoIIIE domain-containing protein [Mycolicibacterium fallax]|nr:FtsK/SpoIIIE domain-containing protein [Mycolicibacterium fallax]BBZ00533.1 hypothetical protein MFAL_39990 [Mycolicibacterium fallax]
MGMFFQGGGGYQPTGREVWHMQQRRQEQQWNREDADQKAADKVLWAIHDQVRAIDAQGHKAVESVAAEVTKAGSTEVKRILSAGVTQYAGATHANRKGIVVWHWRAAPPESVSIRLRRKDAGALVVLPPGGGVPRENHVWRAAARRDQTFLDDTEGKTWAKRSRDLITECEERYPILSRLRDDNWMASFMSAAGMNRESVEQRVVNTSYGEMALPVRTVHVPELVAVEIQQDGLELVFAHREGSSVKDWVARHDKLTAMFKAQGVRAEHLAVSEDADGSVRLRFNDAPSHFPAAVSTEPPTRTATSIAEALSRYERTRWMLGVDARGNTISYPLLSQPHVLVTGGTGGGKSVWGRTLIESLRTGYKDEHGNDCGGGWLAFVGDGKGSDFSALEGQPGIAMVAPSIDVSQIAVMVRRIRVEVERRYAQASAAKKAGDADAFAGMQPWLLLLDEWGSTAIKMTATFGSKGSALFLQDIDIILRLGRECRVHCVLLSQTIRKTGDGAVPGSWQENLGLTVSLGAPSDITLQSEAFTPETRERAAFIGARLKGKQGRGLTADRETGAVIEFQSFYGWSPGTTSLAEDAPSKVRPPTDEVRATWERWVPVCETVPWLAPRMGIKANSPEWRGGEKPDMETVASTETVALTDRDGNVKPGMERYDPASPEWLGAVPIGGIGGGHSALSFDDEDAAEGVSEAEPEAVSEPEPAGDPTKAVEEPAAPTLGLTPEQIRAEVIRLGLIPADATEGVSEAEPEGDAGTEVPAEPAPLTPDKPKPKTKPTTTKPKTKPNNSIGDF